MRPKKFHLIALALLCLIGAVGPSAALGVIVGSTDFSAFSDPLSPYYGMTAAYVYKYGTATGDTIREATVDAIGYFSLITARHYGASVGDKLTLNGDQFQVTAVQTPPPDAGQSYQPDIDILTVENLTHPNRPLPGLLPDLPGRTVQAPTRRDRGGRAHGHDQRRRADRGYRQCGDRPLGHEQVRTQHRAGGPHQPHPILNQRLPHGVQRGRHNDQLRLRRRRLRRRGVL